MNSILRYLLPIVFLIVSCSNNDSFTSEYQIEFNSETELSDFISDCEIVRLEINNDCIISNVDRMHVDSSYYYLQDGNTIYIFNHSGKYVSKISQLGRAEYEYISITDFYVHNGYIYILSNPQRKILTYALDATFVDKLDLNDWYHNLYIDDDRILLYSEKANSSKYDIVEINFAGEIVNQYLPFKIDSGVLYGPSPFNKIENDILLTFPFDHRIICLSNGICEKFSNIKVENCRILTKGELENLSYDDIKRNLSQDNYIKRITGISQKGNQLFVTLDIYLKNKGIRTIVTKIDTHTGKTISYLCGNKIDENYPYFSRLIKMSQDTIYSVLDPLFIYNVDKIRNKTSAELSDDFIMNPSIYKYRINWD